MFSSMQLQDAGCWTDSATLAATHLNGSDYARCPLLFFFTVSIKFKNQNFHYQNERRKNILFADLSFITDAASSAYIENEKFFLFKKSTKKSI